MGFGIGPEVGISYRYNEKINFGTSLALISSELTFDEPTNTSIKNSASYRGGDVDGSTYGGYFAVSVTYNFDRD